MGEIRKTGVPCRQVGVELVKQAYRASEGALRGCWDLMDDLAAGFWAVLPRGNRPEVLRQQLDAAGR